MRRFGWMITALLLLSAAAWGEEWNKSFPVSGQAELRIETSDAQIHVDTWDENKIDAHITSTKWGFGQGGIEVIDHQTGDSVEIEVRFPHGVHVMSVGRPAYRHRDSHAAPGQGKTAYRRRRDPGA